MKRGFTLSELMIAMAVLGILLALVIPIIANVRPNEFKMLTKKAYYVTEQVVSSLINDPQLYPDSTMYCTGDSTDDEDKDSACYYGFDDTSAVAYNGKTADDDYYEGEAKFPRLFADQLNISSCSEYNDEFTGQYFTTNDGIKFIFEFDDDDSGTIAAYTKSWTKGSATDKRTILIDVNGDGEGKDGEDCLYDANTCTHPDRFRIEIQTNGRVNIYEEDTIAAGYIKFDSAVIDN